MFDVFPVRTENLSNLALLWFKASSASSTSSKYIQYIIKLSMSVSLYHHKFGKHVPLIFHHVIFQANSLEIRRLVQMPRLANRMLRGSMLMNQLSWQVWLEDWYCENGLTYFDCNTSTYIYIHIYIYYIYHYISYYIYIIIYHIYIYIYHYIS